MGQLWACPGSRADKQKRGFWTNTRLSPKTVLGTSQAVSSEKGAEDPADAQSVLLERDISHPAAAWALSASVLL